MPSGLARVRPLSLQKSFRQAMPHVTSTTADQKSEPAFFISPNRNCSLTRRCTEPDAPIYHRHGNPLRHPVLSHLFVNLASDVGGNPLWRPVTSYLSVYLASDVGGNPLRRPAQSHQKLVWTCRRTILTSSYVLENISLPCLLPINGDGFFFEL
ncbi:BnaCnng19510D [Brassica napus]|nr:unnamed protein product [Brassica napus]CDY50717.1 BnaCnng19510D [Brassica napus]